MGKQGKHLSAQAVSRIVELADGGMRFGDIAKLMDLTAETVRQRVRQAQGSVPAISGEIVGYGVGDTTRHREELFSKAKQGDPDAVMELAYTYHLTGLWSAGVGTVIARRGFRASTCMVE